MRLIQTQYISSLQPIKQERKPKKKFILIRSYYYHLSLSKFMEYAYDTTDTKEVKKRFGKALSQTLTFGKVNLSIYNFIDRFRFFLKISKKDCYLFGGAVPPILFKEYAYKLNSENPEDSPFLTMIFYLK